MATTQVVNAAHGKPCQQSSVLNGGAPTASVAVDGIRRLAHAFHTDRELHPWWQVDLEVVTPIDRIVIFNVAGKYAIRAAHIAVRLSSDGTNFEEVVYSALNFFGGAEDNSPLSIALRGTVSARYVRIQLVGRGYLHLSQVEIYVRQEDLELARTIAGQGICPKDFFRGRNSRYSEVHFVPRTRPRVEALHVTKFGRFGNIVVCVINAVAVAEWMNVDRILVNIEKLDEGVLTLGDDAGDVSNAITITTDCGDEVEQLNCLAGSFFGIEAFASVKRELKPQNRRAIAQRHLVPLLSSAIRTTPSLKSDDVVIHFRSGDIFTGITAPSYRQPPLEYYKLALDEAIRRGCQTAWVMFEDRRNPAIEPFLEYCATLGIETRLPGSTFVHDLGLMLAARNLVTARSTLAEAILLLARHIEHMWVFEEPELAMLAAELDVACHHIRDTQGTYMQIKSWQNSAEQIDQIVSYPRSALRMERTKSA